MELINKTLEIEKGDMQEEVFKRGLAEYYTDKWIGMIANEKSASMYGGKDVLVLETYDTLEIRDLKEEAMQLAIKELQNRFPYYLILEESELAGCYDTDLDAVRKVKLSIFLTSAHVVKKKLDDLIDSGKLVFSSSRELWYLLTSYALIETGKADNYWFDGNNLTGFFALRKDGEVLICEAVEDLGMDSGRLDYEEIIVRE